MPTSRDEPADLELLRYPLAPAEQGALISLLRTEWTKTDYDWLEAMNGDYGAELAIVSAVIRRAGKPVATATVHFSRSFPEVAVLGNVLTHRAHRGQGLGGAAIDAVLQHARRAGCRLCLLGTSTRPRNVYFQHGFEWQAGNVMRRDFSAPRLEADYFAPSPSVDVRAAHWGDLPGLTLLAAQPLQSVVLDFPRGLLSPRVLPPERCLSNFPLLWSETVARGGHLVVAVAAGAGRVLGFGSATRGPGPGRRHGVVLDLVAHDQHQHLLGDLLPPLLAASRAGGVTRAEAFVSQADEAKLACFRQHGFAVASTLPQALRIDGPGGTVVRLEAAL